jgi:hypothetical protein
MPIESSRAGTGSPYLGAPQWASSLLGWGKASGGETGVRTYLVLTFTSLLVWVFLIAYPAAIAGTLKRTEGTIDDCQCDIDLCDVDEEEEEWEQTMSPLEVSARVRKHWWYTACMQLLSRHGAVWLVASALRPFSCFEYAIHLSSCYYYSPITIPVTMIIILTEPPLLPLSIHTLTSLTLLPCLSLSHYTLSPS